MMRRSLLVVLPLLASCDVVFELETRASLCGDGLADGNTGEDCDDGNLVDGDGCSSLCALEERETCGNSVVAGAEDCDDGNTITTDGCTNSCQIT